MEGGVEASIQESMQLTDDQSRIVAVSWMVG